MSTAPVVPPSVAPEPASAPLSEGARLVNTFFAPSKTFADLRRSAAWWAPFLLIVLTSALFSFAVGSKVGFRKAAENVMQSRPKQWDRIQQLPEDRQERTMNMVEKQTMYGSYAFPVIDLVMLLIIAGILLATFKVAADANVSYKVALAIVMYASLPGILKFLLATVTLFMGIAPDSFNLQNPIATNLGVLFTAADHPALYTLGSMIDIFMFWTLALTAIGFTCVSKAKKGTAFAIVFGWYAVFAILMTGLASLG